MLRSFFVLLLLALPAAAQEAQGLVVPFRSVIVSSPVLQEVIEKVKVEEGDTVKEGDELVVLRHAREELAVLEAESIVKNSEFVARGLEALAKENMAEKIAVLKAQTELELARIRRSLAKQNLTEKTVLAPLSGIVVKKYKESGESVDRAEKVLEIIDIEKLYAQFYLPPKFLQTLKVSQPIEVRFVELPGTAVRATISFMDPRIDASSGLFRVKVLFDNKDQKIKAGMKAVADFNKNS